jgi:hypothetical protein
LGRNVGTLLMRLADRTYDAKASNEPPRNTRPTELLTANPSSRSSADPSPSTEGYGLELS